MAYTNSFLVKTVIGNKRMHVIRSTADAATQAIDTGLDVVEGIFTAAQSMSTAALKFAINELVAGTAANGYVGVSGAASGDEFFITVIGH